MSNPSSPPVLEGKAFQDFYPDHLAHCYGCGRMNEEGLQIKTYWSGEESVTRYLPRPYHTAFPGFVYGGLLASLVDCHGTGTAAAAAYRNQIVLFCHIYAELFGVLLRANTTVTGS